MRPVVRNHKDREARKDFREPTTHHATERTKTKARRAARKVHPRNR